MKVNVFKSESPIEKKLQAIESALLKQNLRIEWRHNGITITDVSSGAVGYLKDTESNDATLTLPRMFEGERIVALES